MLVRTRARLTRSSPLIILLVIVALLVGLPFLMLLVTAFTDAPPRPGAGLGNGTLENLRALVSVGSRNAALNSLWISIGGTLAAMSIGGLLAWIAARTDMPWRPLAQLAGIVPLFTSALVASLAWSLIASPRAGYLNILMRSLGWDITFDIYSFGGMIFLLGIFYAPYAFLFIYSALTLMNPELEEAGSVHGATLPTVTRRLTLPLVTPAIAGSGVLSFVLISENFPVVQVLGVAADIETIPTRLFRLMVAFPTKPNEAAAIGFVLLVVMSALVWLQRRLVARRNYVTVSGKGFRPRVVKLGPYRWLALAFTIAYLIVAVVMPYFALIQSALRRHQFIAGIGDLFDVSAFTLHNVALALNYEPFQLGMRNSFLVATMTAIVGGALHFSMAYTARRTSIPGRSLLEYSAAVPLAMPSLVLGMAFLWTWIRLPISIHGTLFILVMAYATRFMPQGFQGIAGTVSQIDRDLEDAAVVAGATRPTAVRRVTLPLIRTGVVSTMLLLFILSFRELSAALFLFTSDTRLVSIVIYDQWEGGRWPRVAAMSLTYSAVLLVVTLVGRRWFGLGRQRA